LGTQNEDRLAEEEYYVRWLDEKRSWREKWRSFGRERERWGMNTGCDVWWNNAVMLKDKRWYRYQATRIISEVPGFAARVAAGGMGVWWW